MVISIGPSSNWEHGASHKGSGSSCEDIIYACSASNTRTIHISIDSVSSADQKMDKLLREFHKNERWFGLNLFNGHNERICILIEQQM